MPDRETIVTIDGPSGAGKSTISRLLAAALNFTYLDTGAMYRAVALAVRRAGLDPDNQEDLKRLPELLDNIDIRLAAAGKDTRVFLNSEDISLAIRTEEISMLASRVSALAAVRKKLTAMQQELGRQGRVVAEGRDMGTVVFPDARHKFYLDATPEERARRRRDQLAGQGQEVDINELLAQINKRDHDDSARSLAPLRPAVDALIVDSSERSIKEVVNYMLDHIN